MSGVKVDMEKSIFFADICLLLGSTSLNVFYYILGPPGGNLYFEIEPSCDNASFKKARSYVAKRSKKICTKKFCLSWFPIMQWAPNYNFKSFGCDILAGLTLALVVLPQGIAFAPLAGLPIQVRGTSQTTFTGWAKKEGPPASCPYGIKI